MAKKHPVESPGVSSVVSVFTSIRETDRLTISEFADLFGFPASAVISAIEKNRGAIKKPFYTIPELADR